MKNKVEPCSLVYILQPLQNVLIKTQFTESKMHDYGFYQIAEAFVSGENALILLMVKEVRFLPRKNCD